MFTVSLCFGMGSRSNAPEFCFSFLLQDVDRYTTFSMLPRDISQQIFNDLVYSRCLTDESLEAFRDCALQVALYICYETWLQNHFLFHYIPNFQLLN